MNFLQKAWLKILSPVIPLVNDKLAKKGGILGRIGKFWAFGPRQFGYHPTSRYLALFNQMLLQNIGLGMHRHSFIKNMAQTGYFNHRPYSLVSTFGMFLIFTTMIYVTVPICFRTEEGTTLQVLTNKKIPVHYSSLNDRVSAHYSEINNLYQWEMMKRMEAKAQEISRQRAGLNDKTKKTRFAREGYNYIEAHTKTQ